MQCRPDLPSVTIRRNYNQVLVSSRLMAVTINFLIVYDSPNRSAFYIFIFNQWNVVTYYSRIFMINIKHTSRNIEWGMIFVFLYHYITERWRTKYKIGINRARCLQQYCQRQKYDQLVCFNYLTFLLVHCFVV